MRSLAASLPALCCFSMRCFPPPSLIFAFFSRSSAVRSFIVEFPGLSIAVAMSDLPGKGQKSKDLRSDLVLLHRCHCDFVFLAPNTDDVAAGWSGIVARAPQCRGFGAGFVVT